MTQSAAGAITKSAALATAIGLLLQAATCFGPLGAEARAAEIMAETPAEIESATPTEKQSVAAASSRAEDEQQQPALIAATTASPARISAEAPALPESQADAGGAADQAVLRGGVAATPDAASGRVEDLTKQILLKEIELERFNLHYTQEVAKQGRWKGWRYGMLNEVNSGMGLAGAIISVGERGTHIHNPEHVSAARQENANFIPMIGAIIGASAGVLEFSINEYHDFQARGKGFAPHAALAHVQQVRDEIDSMLAERDMLRKIEASAPMLSARAELDDIEGKVLHDLRDQNLQEFERFHIGGRKLLAFQQMQYVFDFCKNTTNAIGYEFAYLSLHRHRRVWNGRAGVLFATSGVLFMAGPIVSRLFAKAVGEAHRHWLVPTTRTAETATFECLKRDHAALDAMCQSGKCPPEMVLKPLERSVVYGAQEKSFEDELRANAKSRAKAKLAATQNVGTGLYVGGTKLASGILFMIPGFDHNFNAKKGYRAAHVTNSDLFVSSLISIPSTMFAMIDTLRINVQGEIKRHELIKAGVHPSQLTKARLAQLDDLEAKIRAQK